ncbi:MAG TPA: hypothetical protein VGK05_02070 [Acidimicrobiia bacterium]
MSPVLTRPRPRSVPVLIRRDVVVVVLAGAIAITTLVGLHAALRGPHLVDRVTVANETPYLVDIEATRDTRDGWLKLGPISAGEKHSFGSVVDQGDRWIFRVTAGPYNGGEFSLSKTELERAQWRVAIPRDAQQRLEAKGAVPLQRR